MENGDVNSNAATTKGSLARKTFNKWIFVEHTMADGFYNKQRLKCLPLVLKSTCGFPESRLGLDVVYKNNRLIVDGYYSDR